jgi:PBSX family phage terminase large subunit
MWSEKRKIALWVGAVSAGKTVASLLAFMFALHRAPAGELVVIIGKTLQSIEDNVINPLQNPTIFGALAAHTVHTRGSNYAIILGRRVELIGANNTRAEERIRGATYALAYVDEATLLPPNFWAMLLTRLRVKGARLLATTNPGSRNHWLKVDYIDRRDLVDMIVFHLTMRDNPSLDSTYIETMQRTFADPVLHARFILGLWTAAEGAVYSDFDTRPLPIDDPRAHTIRFEDMPPLADILAVGMDWGTTNASTGILLGITAETTLLDSGRRVPKPRMILMDEWRYDSRVTGLQLSPAKQADDFTRWYQGADAPADRRGFVRAHVPPTVLMPRDRPVAGLIVDPAAAGFRRSLLDAGFHNAPAANDVLKGISTVSNLISSHHLLVTDHCQGFLNEVTEYVWDKKKSDEKGTDYPVTENDHSLDAARYALYTTRPLWWPVMRDAYQLAA